MLVSGISRLTCGIEMECINSLRKFVGHKPLLMIGELYTSEGAVAPPTNDVWPYASAARSGAVADPAALQPVVACRAPTTVVTRMPTIPAVFSVFLCWSTW